MATAGNNRETASRWAFDPAMAVYVEPVLAWKRETEILIVEREIRLVNTADGFAGTADVMFRYGENGIGILDYKTRKTEPGKPVGAMDRRCDRSGMGGWWSRGR